MFFFFFFFFIFISSSPENKKTPPYQFFLKKYLIKNQINFQRGKRPFIESKKTGYYLQATQKIEKFPSKRYQKI